jgi:hypothetical protein
MSGKLAVTCADWRPLRRGTLRGFARIRVADLDLTIHDIAIHEKNDRLWAQMPSRPWLKDGAAVRGDDGKVQYSPIMEFGRREVREAFSRAVILAVMDFSPDAFAKESVA